MAGVDGESLLRGAHPAHTCAWQPSAVVPAPGTWLACAIVRTARAHGGSQGLTDCASEDAGRARPHGLAAQARTGG